MAVIALYKWTFNPQDATVTADGTVQWSGAKAAVSEYDTVAIEVARQVADANATECVGVSVGAADAASGLARKSVMARGLDWAAIVADDATTRWNATDVARALAALVKRVEGTDLVLAGDVSLDEGAGIVPSLTAGFLGWPCLLEVASLERSADGWIVQQVVPGGARTVTVKGPLVAAVVTDAAKPRVPGVKDILAAGKKRVDVVPLAEVPAAISALTVTEQSKPTEAGRLGKVFTGATAVADIINTLHADGVL